MSADEAVEAVLDALQRNLDEAQANPGKFNPESKLVDQSIKVATAEGIPACGGP